MVHGFKVTLKPSGKVQALIKSGVITSLPHNVVEDRISYKHQLKSSICTWDLVKTLGYWHKHQAFYQVILVYVWLPSQETSMIQFQMPKEHWKYIIQGSYAWMIRLHQLQIYNQL